MTKSTPLLARRARSFYHSSAERPDDKLERISSGSSTVYRSARRRARPRPTTWARSNASGEPLEVIAGLLAAPRSRRRTRPPNPALLQTAGLHMRRLRLVPVGGRSLSKGTENACLTMRKPAGFIRPARSRRSRNSRSSSRPGFGASAARRAGAIAERDVFAAIGFFQFSTWRCACAPRHDDDLAVVLGWLIKSRAACWVRVLISISLAASSSSFSWARPNRR